MNDYCKFILHNKISVFNKKITLFNDKNHSFLFIILRLLLLLLHFLKKIHNRSKAGHEYDSYPAFALLLYSLQFLDITPPALVLDRVKTFPGVAYSVIVLEIEICLSILDARLGKDPHDPRHNTGSHAFFQICLIHSDKPEVDDFWVIDRPQDSHEPRRRQSPSGLLQRFRK